MAITVTQQKVARRNKVRSGIRKKIKGTAQRPRLSIYRSNKQIYAQLIDDINGHTLVAASTFIDLKDEKGNNSEMAKKVGSLIASKAKETGITKVVFDRGGYLYHGRVKALAEGAREGGLEF